MRLRLTIAYDGAGFAGWQSQSSGDGVQDVIEFALKRIASSPVKLHGAGRTDAGVHALAQIAHFDAPDTSRMTPAEWQRALNGILPPTVRILRIAKSSKDFHARFSATGKIYRYELWTGDVLPPHLHRRAWRLSHPLDRDGLHEALRIFEGTHDFRAFAANRGTPVASTVRTIRSIKIKKTGPLLRISFEGDGFLYKMVRMLVGAAVRVGTGREKPETLQALIRGTGRWTHVAPADGLYLVRVRY
jgi:tRNA pseudouridine38-40 synthase